jgi:hypothetical protein
MTDDPKPTAGMPQRDQVEKRIKELEAIRDRKIAAVNDEMKNKKAQTERALQAEINKERSKVDALRKEKKGKRDAARKEINKWGNEQRKAARKDYRAAVAQWNRVLKGLDVDAKAAADKEGAGDGSESADATTPAPTEATAGNPEASGGGEAAAEPVTPDGYPEGVAKPVGAPSGVAGPK